MKFHSYSLTEQSIFAINLCTCNTYMYKALYIRIINYILWFMRFLKSYKPNLLFDVPCCGHPKMFFYKLANQDTRIWLTVTSPSPCKWCNNELLKTCRFVFYEQGGRYLLEDSAALYTCNINVIGLYIYPQLRK